MDNACENILMRKDDIGLIAVSQTFHVFPRDGGKLLVAQVVFRIGIQRYMEYGVCRVAVRLQSRAGNYSKFCMSGRPVAGLSNIRLPVTICACP